jgi:hypothetical protein
MSKATFGTITATIALGCLLIPMLGAAERQEGQSTAGSPFGGKILTISLRSDPDAGCVVKDVSLRRLGEQSFLVGTGVDTGHPDNWQEGRTIWVAIDDVCELVEFESIDDYRGAVSPPQPVGISDDAAPVCALCP